jgi:hypothetical protein
MSPPQERLLFRLLSGRDRLSRPHKEAILHEVTRRIERRPRAWSRFSRRILARLIAVAFAVAVLA